MLPTITLINQIHVDTNYPQTKIITINNSALLTKITNKPSNLLSPKWTDVIIIYFIWIEFKIPINISLNTFHIKVKFFSVFLFFFAKRKFIKHYKQQKRVIIFPATSAFFRRRQRRIRLDRRHPCLQTRDTHCWFVCLLVCFKITIISFHSYKSIVGMPGFWLDFIYYDLSIV